MVFGYFLPQKDGLAGAFRKITVHGPVHDAAGAVIMPVLASLGGKNGVLHGKNECAAAAQAMGNLPADAGEIPRVVKGQ